MPILGKLNKITDLRSVWPHEANNFTKWLVKDENLSLLSDTIGIDIEFEDRESNVGDFSVDIYAKEEGTNKNIIIENQLEDTDHNHLGKLITYASGKNASYIIWIVKNARDEHRNAIEWLNNHTDESVGFFLLEIELWQIDSSNLAPKFNIVESPNNWAKEIKNNNDTISELKSLQLLFWEKFKNYASSKPDFIKRFSLRKPHPHHWYDISIGTSQSHIALTVNTKKDTINAGIYINDNKDLYNKFYEGREQIEKELGDELHWSIGSKDARFYISKNINITSNEQNWEECFKWFCAMIEKLYNIYQQFK
ncbi:MAG: DUF4268 domain-containing protein [Desulfovibrio sp.]|nr:DUF4268 domain-containing protein [Desulfovibrio sp.]